MAAGHQRDADVAHARLGHKAPAHALEFKRGNGVPGLDGAALGAVTQHLGVAGQQEVAHQQRIDHPHFFFLRVDVVDGVVGDAELVLKDVA